MSEAKILVVDDDANIRFAFHEVLEKEGHVCLEAKDGAEALQQFSDEQPRVVFMDIVLPDTNGLDVLSAIKKIDASVPVVVISGYGTEEAAKQIKQLGAFDFLHKPLSVVKVREAIHKALET
jgi:two-component system C4-dicarboxylate transport response regulator DctD